MVMNTCAGLRVEHLLDGWLLDIAQGRRWACGSGAGQPGARGLRPCRVFCLVTLFDCGAMPRGGAITKITSALNDLSRRRAHVPLRARSKKAPTPSGVSAWPGNDENSQRVERFVLEPSAAHGLQRLQNLIFQIGSFEHAPAWLCICCGVIEPMRSCAPS